MFRIPFTYTQADAYTYVHIYVYVHILGANTARTWRTMFVCVCSGGIPYVCICGRGGDGRSGGVSLKWSYGCCLRAFRLRAGFCCRWWMVRHATVSVAAVCVCVERAPWRRAVSAKRMYTQNYKIYGSLFVSVCVCEPVRVRVSVFLA